MARRIRISGLVRAANAVRREIAGGITPQRREQLRTQVDGQLRRIERMLREAGAQAAHLPPPSRRAIQFLSELRWDEFPVSETPHAGQTSSEVRWAGLKRHVERAMDRLSQPITAAELDVLSTSLARMSRQIEGTIERQRITPDRIAPVSRALRGWLAFLSHRENIQAYVDAVQRVMPMLTEAMSVQRRFPPPLVVHFRPMQGIFKLRAKRHGSLLSLPTPAICFDRDSFLDLCRLIFQSGGESRRRVIARMTSEAYQALHAELESLSGVIEQTSGAFHDLAVSFERVNARYFGGRMPRPRLTWSRSMTGRKFGHYDWIQDTVMVSRTLDAAAVPAFLVDYIVYHELLHKQHGIHWVNGRGFAHTTEFQNDERRFERYQEAEAALERLASLT